MRRLLVVLIAASWVSACSPKPDTSSCVPAPDAVVGELQSSLIRHGTLRHAFTTRTRDGVLVSAELHLARDQEDKKGNVLTWVGAGGSFRAVDMYARRESSLPTAPFDVRRDGVYALRACVASSRG